jgi:hypothetical protein
VLTLFTDLIKITFQSGVMRKLHLCSCWQLNMQINYAQIKLECNTATFQVHMALGAQNGKVVHEYIPHNR